MPRVHRSQQASVSKIKQCLKALVTDPEAACLGGNELSCAGCAGNSHLVDSLCAFCLHSDAARRYFVSNGGLDALLLAGRSSQSEKTTLAALQVLQCLCSTQLGQLLVVTQRPELLQMVCDQALDQDEENEGLQHAALTILADWAADDTDSQLLSWFAHCPAIKQQSPQAMRQVPMGLSPVFGTGTMLPLSDSKLASNAAPQLPSPTSNCMSISEPAMLHIASRALQHPTLAVRRAAAQLFAITAASGTPDAAAAAVSRLSSLSTQVQQLLHAEHESLGAPRFAAYANGHSQLMLDPMAFLRHQEHIQQQKQACHALMHTACELAAAGPKCLSVLGEAHGCLLALVAVFESAWQVSTCRQPTVSGTVVLPGDVPFSFLQDHQSRELALDALVIVLKQPRMLACLGRSLQAMEKQEESWKDGATLQPSTVVAATTASTVTTAATAAASASTNAPAADASTATTTGAANAPEPHPMPVSGEEEAAEQRALKWLLLLVHRLFRQQSAGHVRAALTLIGRVRFDHPPAETVGSAHSLWLLQLCDLFDATWHAEQSELQGQGTDSALAEACPGQVPPAPQAWWPGQQAGVQPQGATAGADQRHGGACADDSQAIFTLDVGLGYRVLVQVLQAWKSLLDSQAPAVVKVLECSGYAERATLAVSHPKPMVVTAAHKVLHHGTAAAMQPADAAQQRQAGFGDSAVWADWGAWNGLDGMQGGIGLDSSELGTLVQQDEAYMAAAAAAMGFSMDPAPAGPGIAAPGGIIPEEDEEMQEFLSVFLDNEADGTQGPDGASPVTLQPDPAPTGLVPSAGRRAAQGRGAGLEGMFSSWEAAGGQEEDDAVLTEALMLLPDLDNVAQNMCVKYDSPRINRRPGAAMASPLAMLML